MRRYLLPLTMLLLIVAVLFWAWSRLPATKPRVSAVPAVRVVYDGTQPLRLTVLTAVADANGMRLQAWLRDELDHWLAHAQRVRYDRGAVSRDPAIFTLQVLVQAPSEELRLRLLAPDGGVEREEALDVQDIGLPFATVLAERVPVFLGLNANWQDLIGTGNADHYAAVVRAREHLRGEQHEQREAKVKTGRTVGDIDALERVTRQEKGYARAWSTLALTYAQVKGEDATSLATLALNAAERAIALDPAAAEAQAIRGLIQYRRGQWLAAHEQLLHALQLQPREPIALTALACLLVDAGLNEKALPIAQRAALVRPQDGETRECLSFARAATRQPIVDSRDAPPPFAAARVVATIQLLNDDLAGARQTYEGAIERERLDAPWLNPLLSAAADSSQTVDALRAITSAASEQLVDAQTEVLAGVALKRGDFVLNRLVRLQRAKEDVPLRILWLPQAKGLREHANFDDVIRASDLPSFWVRYGKPDICDQEPTLFVCG